jgi:hypothetical protein
MSLEGETSNLARIISTQCSIEDSRRLTVEGLLHRIEETPVWYGHARRRTRVGDMAGIEEPERHTTERRGGPMDGIGGRSHDGNILFL